MEESTLGEAADASTGDIEYEVPDVDDNTPVSCGIVPIYEDGVLVSVEQSFVPGFDFPPHGENTPTPVDDASDVVVDDLPSSRRLLAHCCGLPWTCIRWRSTSAAVSSSGILSWICARWCSVSAKVASSGMFILLPSMHLFLAAGNWLSRLDIPFCWGVASSVPIAPSRG